VEPNQANPLLTSQPSLGSVVIPAHNEAGVIGRCLHALVEGFSPGELEVVVVCNGCRDDTAAVARSIPYGVTVIELSEASKPAALRAGDSATRSFPRLYLDADVVLTSASARAVLDHLSGPGAIAARPPVSYDFTNSSPLVRRYYRARARIPAVLGSLWGAGVYGLSAAGRARFDAFPDVVGDDLWLDKQFEAHEVQIVDCAPVVVVVPEGAADLMHVLRRTYRGKAEHRGPGKPAGRGKASVWRTLADLGRLLRGGPAAGADALTYATFAAGARLALAVATVTHAGTRWERDDSSRRSAR
jgi:hypothetical protein